MIRVGITGASGQFGYVLSSRLRHHHGLDVVHAGRVDFEDNDGLERFAGSVDCIIHLAGANRGPDNAITEVNVQLARKLAAACAGSGSRASIVYASTTHRDRDTAYGTSKSAAGEILSTFAQQAGLRFCEIVLPNLFGEFTKPYYNSFVGTFCDQIVQGQLPSVDSDAEIRLLHYVQAADEFARAIERGLEGQIRPEGSPTTVQSVADILVEFHRLYRNGVIPDIQTGFRRDLFNTLRSYMYPDIFPFALTPHADARGTFFECVRSHNGGQTSFSTTLPGITRGNHFHFHKVERFLVLSGEARISVRRIGFEDVRDFYLSGKEPCFIDMPTFHTHHITNVGTSDLLTLFWTHEHFDPNVPDTYMETV